MKLRAGPALSVALTLVAIGCGKMSATNADGGDASVTNPDAPAARRAFDVVAVLRSDGGTPSIPPTSRFTLIVDPAANLAIAGGNGQGAVVPLSTSDGKTFRSTGEFAAAFLANACGDGPQAIHYHGFEVTLSERELTGRAPGTADISCGDCTFTVPLDATLSGTIDTTAPTLLQSTSPTTPFDGFRLSTSEPLPATASARLIADDGVAIDLSPVIIDGEIPIVVGFFKPDVVLRAGHGYGVDTSGLVDFAGQTQGSGPLIRLGSFPAAPPIAQDGFESATGTTLGGAMIMTEATLPPIAGMTSLYIGGRGAPALDTAAPRSLSVKLSRRPGDTTLRFSYRVVGPRSQPSFNGALYAGSEGGSSPSPTFLNLTSSAGPPDSVTLAGQTVYIGALATQSIALPADVTDEVLVMIAPSDFNCGPAPPGDGGLLIDDLRLE